MLQASTRDPFVKTSLGFPTARRVKPLERWHLLSLDAPCVAALWTWAVAEAAGVSLHWAEIAAMFVAVWMLYAADRLLDAAPLRHGAAQALEARHHFHHRHRKGFYVALGMAAAVLAALLLQVPWPELRGFLWLAALLGGWLLVVHVLSGDGAQRLPKELAVGLFFPAAVFTPAWAHLHAGRAALLPFALGFAAVCTLNCLFLYAWEHPGSRAEAHVSTRIAVRWLMPTTVLLLVFAGGLCGWALHSGMAVWLPGAMMVSMALLLVLHLGRRQLSTVTLRALADAALLTPLPVLLVAHHALLR